MDKGLILWLILAPIVCFIGYMITWVCKSNNPFWVKKTFDNLKIGSIWWAKGSPDRFPKDSKHYYPNHRTFIVTDKKSSFLKWEVYGIEYINGNPITGEVIHLHASTFFWAYSFEKDA